MTPRDENPYSAAEIPLDPVRPPGEDLPLRASDEIQGNILAGFNKDHQMFVFLHFPEAERARGWLGKLASRIATTKQVAVFNAQFSNARRLRGGDDPENLKAVWINVGLTYPGLQALTPALARELEADEFAEFRTGPVERAGDLGDDGESAPDQWWLGAPTQLPVHAVLTVAADERDELRLELDKMRTLAAAAGIVTVFEQRGDTLPGRRRGHEHFGFKDGISQPGVRGFHPPDPENPGEALGHPGTDLIEPGEFLLGYPNEAGETRPVPAWAKDGSFQVFRRLRQDVPGWWAQVTALAQSPGFADPPKEDELAAKMVGRWRSGTPLDHAPTKDNRSARDRNRDIDFEFEGDPDGHKTPLFSHIRKMYPRENDKFEANRRRIIRRGIPFGAPFDPAAGRGHGVDAERGLLFNVFMASIRDQFEFLQTTWASNAGFPPAASPHGPDPVIGVAGQCRFARAGMADQALDVRRFVHTTGAVYAFAPSISALRQIAGDGASPDG